MVEELAVFLLISGSLLAMLIHLPKKSRPVPDSLASYLQPMRDYLRSLLGLPIDK